MNIGKYIVINPEICHGKPCFKGMRIMVYLVLEMLAAGESPDEIINNAYPQLTKKHIEAALQYAANMAQKGHVVNIRSKSYAIPC